MEDFEQPRRQFEDVAPNLQEKREESSFNLRISELVIASLSSAWKRTDSLLDVRLCPDGAPINNSKKGLRRRDEWRWDAIMACVHVIDTLSEEYEVSPDINQTEMNKLIDVFLLFGTVKDLISLLQQHIHEPSRIAPLREENDRMTVVRIIDAVCESLREIRVIDEDIPIDSKTLLNIHEHPENNRRLDYVEIVDDLIQAFGFPDICENIPPDEVMNGTVGKLANWLYRKYCEALSESQTNKAG